MSPVRRTRVPSPSRRGLPPPVPPEDHHRFALRAGERDDRQEALLTYLLSRAGTRRLWRTPFGRDSKDRPVVGETGVQDDVPAGEAPFFKPIEQVWERWSDPDQNRSS